VERAQLEQAAQVVAAGGIIAYPTESCYGLGCDPRQSRAVRRLLHIKRRPWSAGLILIGAHFYQFARYVDLTPSPPLDRALATWPGFHTWLLPAYPGVSRWLRGEHDSIALRVTAHPVAAALCRHARRALVSTSANRHGRPPATSAGAVVREFGAEVDFVLAGRLGGAERPSEIRNAANNRLIRAG